MCNKVLNTNVECLYAIYEQILKCLFSLVVHIYIYIYIYIYMFLYIYITRVASARFS